MANSIFFFFFSICIFLWLWDGIRRRFTQTAKEWIQRMAAVVMTALPFSLDIAYYGSGLPVQLLSSCLLLADAILLTTPSCPKYDYRVLFVPAVMAVVCSILPALRLCGSPLPYKEEEFTAFYVSLALIVKMLSDNAGKKLSSKGKLSGSVNYYLILILLACTLLARGGDGGLVADAMDVLFALALAGIYSDLYLQSFFAGEYSLRWRMEGNAARKEAKPVEDKGSRGDILFDKVEKYMREEQPYLEYDFSLIKLAHVMLTNKTTLSKIINDKSGYNFSKYVNRYRVDYAIGLMKQDKRLKVGELAIMSGFHSPVTFNLAFKFFTDDTPSEYMRTLHSVINPVPSKEAVPFQDTGTGAVR